MATVLLERDMPAAALSEYLASHEATAPLADKLAAAVDGNLLIELIKEAGKADASAIADYFVNAPLGNVDHLALMLHRFIEVETGQLQKKEKKAADKDRARIAAQVAEEQARSVSAVAGKLLFQAHRASAQAGEAARHQRLRSKYETEGMTIAVTLPEALQPHMKHLLDHMDEVLASLSPHPPYCGGKLVYRETVQKKGKGRSAVVENKTLLKIRVPGVAVARYLAERERSSGPEAVTFLLLQKQGPYCQAQFMGHVSSHMHQSQVHGCSPVSTAQRADTPRSLAGQHRQARQLDRLDQAGGDEAGGAGQDDGAARRPGGVRPQRAQRARGGEGGREG